MARVSIALMILGLFAVAWALSADSPSKAQKATSETAGLDEEWQRLQSKLNDQRAEMAKTRQTGIRHDVPPPIGMLANDKTLQERYDAEAVPGEFVTPPAAAATEMPAK